MMTACKRHSLWNCPPICIAEVPLSVVRGRRIHRSRRRRRESLGTDSRVLRVDEAAATPATAFAAKNFSPPWRRLRARRRAFAERNLACGAAFSKAAELSQMA
jgi:hypothetical protein